MRGIRSILVSRVHDQGGASFVGVVVTLLVLLALAFAYLRTNTGGERTTGVTAVDASRGVACRVQRQQIERDLMAWSVEHPDDTPSIAALEADGVGVPACPDGGQYSVSGRAVVCSAHR